MHDLNDDNMQFGPRHHRRPGGGPRPGHRDAGGRGGWARGQWVPGSRDDFTADPSTPRERPVPPLGWGGPFSAIFANRAYDGRGIISTPFGTNTFGRGSAGGARTPRGGIRLGLLALLAEGEQNGYGLIKAFGEKSGGNWTPAPGTVYPALGQLVEAKLANVSEEGTYSLTEAGRAEAEAMREQTDALFARMAAGQPEADLFNSVQLAAKALLQFAHDEQDLAKRAKIAGMFDDIRKEIHRLQAE